MTLPALTDAPARSRIRTALDQSLFVEAAAGTGKTTEIVARIVAMLASGHATVASLVAVTFLEKAAGELKLRLRTALDRARETAQDERERTRLDDALAHLEEARISTIHGFCADLLAEHPVEAGLDPAFAMLTEPEARALYEEAFRTWLEQRLSSPGEGLRRLVRRTAKDDSVTARLLQDGWKALDVREYTAKWERVPFDRVAATDRLVEQLRAFAAALSTNSSDEFAYSLRNVRSLVTEIDRAEAATGARDHDGLEATLIDLLDDWGIKEPWRGEGPFSRQYSREQIWEMHSTFKGELESFRDAADADLAPLLQEELEGAAASYELLKSRRGVVDFGDQLVRMRDLLRSHAAIRHELQFRFTHIFVDEFQDTSEVQVEILLLLAAKNSDATSWRDVVPKQGKLFVVGDPKQSIYRFRRADLAVYGEVRKQLLARGVEYLELSTSFRGVPAIQRLANAAFAPLMTGGDAQAQYVPLREHHGAISEQPALIALPVPNAVNARGKVTKGAIRRSSSRAVGAFIDWLIRESGWHVRDPDTNALVPIAARHICLLFRVYRDWDLDVTREYIFALDAYDVPHIVVGGRSLHAREEVETLRVALMAIEYPDDDLAIYATLRGGLIAFTDAELLEYRDTVGPFHYFRVPDEVPAHLQPIAETLRFLRSLHRARNYRPVADTIQRLLEYARAFANFAFRPSGEQVLANVILVTELARAYDASEALSFRGFVHQLTADAERAQATEAPTLEEGSEGVRMMTVHKAKGLEFPVVILADLPARRSPTRLTRHVESAANLAAFTVAGCAPRELLAYRAAGLAAEAAEGVRHAYVGATRARDLLVIPALAGETYADSWLAPLHAAITPQRGTQPSRAPVWTRPFAPVDGRSDRIQPGEYIFGSPASAFAVTWWDLASLDLEREFRFGVRQKALLEKDAPEEVIAADLAAFQAWEEARAATIEEAGRPSIQISTVTDYARMSHVVSDAVTYVQLPRTSEAAPPSGPRFGTLVHSILAAAPLTGTVSEIEAVAETMGTLLDATDDEVTAAAGGVVTALAHPLLKRAAAAASSGRCLRETPITFRTETGILLEGVIDLAFDEDGSWTVLDFKTDADLKRERATYERQLSIYTAAVREATGKPAAGVLFHI